MENKHVKIGPTLLGIIEKQIKTIVRYHYLPTGLAKMKNSNKTDDGAARNCPSLGTLLGMSVPAQPRDSQAQVW